MPKVYLRGDTLRISLLGGGRGAVYRLHDVGRRGHTYRLAMRRGRRWVTKGWWLRLTDFRGEEEALESLARLRLPPGLLSRAEKLVAKYYRGRLKP